MERAFYVCDCCTKKLRTNVVCEGPQCPRCCGTCRVNKPGDKSPDLDKLANRALARSMTPISVLVLPRH